MKGLVRGLVLASVVGFSASAACAAETADVLYDIDFSTPYHTGGLPVSLDTGAIPREGFTGYAFTTPGNEAVMDSGFSLRAMTAGVARFDLNAQAVLEVESGSFNGAPIPGADYDKYVLEFDAVVPADGSLTVFFDSPSINRIRFNSPSAGSEGGVYYGTLTSAPQLTTYTVGEFLAVKMTLDMIGQTWTIEIDGEVLHDGALQNAATTLAEVRFSVGDPVVLDNIRLTGLNNACSSADLNGDGILDLSDISAFISAFQGGCSE